MILSAAIVVALLFHLAKAQVINLDRTANWSLHNAHGPYNISLSNINVPSYVLDTLQAHGVLNEPYLHRFNERLYSWVADAIWTYTAQWHIPDSSSSFFTLPQAPEVTKKSAPKSRILLVLHGIDTAASISLNNRSLGETANAHRRHVFDVTGLLNPGSNVLSIQIFPAAQYSTLAARNYPYPVPFNKQLGSTGQYNFLRKAASDFGWDWGPAFTPAGISGNVQLIASSNAVLMDVGIRQNFLKNGSILVTGDAFLRPVRDEMEEGELRIEIFRKKEGKEEQKWVGNAIVEVLSMAEAVRSKICGHSPEVGRKQACPASMTDSLDEEQGSVDSGALETEESAALVTRHSVRVVVDPPFDLWWPWDLASSIPNATSPSDALYNVTVTYAPRENAIGAQHAQQAVHRRIGFRAAELLRTPTPNGGETFQFQVNGVPIFARGANVVPLDVLETRVSEKKVRATVSSARDANMNMLRVWGGGRYFSDAFYEACDELGILIWQEFMFACAMYPRLPSFLLDISEESRQQILRLNSHPSVILWGGNNENEASFDWFPETLSDPKLYAVDYNTIFVGTLRNQILEIDPGILYVDSSPSNGIFPLISSTTATFPHVGIQSPASAAATKEESKWNLFYVKRWGNVQDPSNGDVHFYDYHSNLFDPEVYPGAKFVSEFGFMSLPSFETFAGQSAEQDWKKDSELMKYRMRHAHGMEELEKQLNMHFICSNLDEICSRNNVAVAMAEGNVTAAGLSFSSSSPFPGAATSNTSSLDVFKGFLYLTQLQQALIYETAALKWRRARADSTAATAGLLYWQLNDIWAGPSWSSINSDGKWKLLHYAARKFFNPIAVSGVVVSPRNRIERKVPIAVEAWVINDLPVEVPGELSVELIPFNATSARDAVVLVDKLKVRMPKSAAGVAWRSNFDKTSWQSVAAAAPFVFLRLRLCWNSIDLRDKRDCSESILLLDEPKNVQMVPVSVDAQVEPVGGATREPMTEQLILTEKVFDTSRDGSLFTSVVEPPQQEKEESGQRSGDVSSSSQPEQEFHIILTARGGVALYVALETPFSGIFSDNIVTVMPWEAVVIIFTATTDADDDAILSSQERKNASARFVTEQAFRDSLRVTWLQGVPSSSFAATTTNGANTNTALHHCRLVCPALVILFASLIDSYI